MGIPERRRGKLANSFAGYPISDSFPNHGGVGRGGGVGRDLGTGVLLGVGVGRTVAVGVGLGVTVGVGVGVGVPPPTGPWIATVIGDPVLKKSTVALVACGG